MRERISCEIIQDLLPNYIENIVSNETKDLVSEHLNICNSCKKEYENMSLPIHIDPIGKIKIDYLKGIHKKSRNILIMCIVLCLASFLISVFYSELNFDEALFTLVFCLFTAIILLIYALPLFCSIICILLYRKNLKNWLLLISAISICIFIFLIMRLYTKSKYSW